MTLIEIVIALAVAGLLVGTMASGIGALTGARAQSAAAELAGVMRALYQTASLKGQTCRLAFVLPEAAESTSVKYRAECAAGSVTVGRERDARPKGRDKEAAQAKRAEGAEGDAESAQLAGALLKSFGLSDAPTLTELAQGERGRVENVAKFSAYTDDEIREREFPEAVRVSVWTAGQKERTSKGHAFVYFFPQGNAERALVEVKQGDNIWTLVLSPLTGTVKVVPATVELPR